MVETLAQDRSSENECCQNGLLGNLREGLEMSGTSVVEMATTQLERSGEEQLGWTAPKAIQNLQMGGHGVDGSLQVCWKRRESNVLDRTQNGSTFTDGRTCCRRVPSSLEMQMALRIQSSCPRDDCNLLRIVGDGDILQNLGKARSRRSHCDDTAEMHQLPRGSPLGKGKGGEKGKGKGKGDKSTKPKECLYCGKPDHNKNECRNFSAALRKKSVQPDKAGRYAGVEVDPETGRRKPSGGKGTGAVSPAPGLDTCPINENDSDQDVYLFPLPMVDECNDNPEDLMALSRQVLFGSYKKVGVPNNVQTRCSN